MPILTAGGFAYQRTGGVSRYFAELHAALRRGGTPSTIAAPLWISEHLSRQPGARGWRLPTWLDVPGSHRTLRALGDVERWALSYIGGRNHDPVLHQTYYNGRPSRLPVVLTVFDLIHEDHPDLFTRSDRTVELKRRSISQANALITISEYTRARLLSHYSVDPARVRTVHLAASPTTPDPVVARQLGQSEPYILFVGQRGGYKNFERFAHAIAQLAQPRSGLRVVAFGGGQPTQVELSLLSNLGLSDRVTFVTGSDQLLAAYYAEAQILVYPSLDEGFGLPPLEAMGHGCVVAAARAGSMPEVLGDAAAWFDPNDIGHIADVAQSALGNSALREHLRQKGRQTHRRYTWDRTAAKTLEVYRSVARLTS